MAITNIVYSESVFIYEGSGVFILRDFVFQFKKKPCAK